MKHHSFVVRLGEFRTRQQGRRWAAATGNATSESAKVGAEQESQSPGPERTGAKPGGYECMQKATLN